MNPRLFRLATAVALFCALAPTRGSATLRISEFMASNDGSLLDGDGDSSDWIEIENTGAAAVSVAGWYLTDDPLDPNRWALPDVTLEAGGHLLVFASGKDRAVAGAELHTDFQLDAGGEYLALFAPGGVAATEFAPRFPDQHTDVSFGTAVETAEDLLASPVSPARFWVPADGLLGQGWTAPAFDDSAWAAVAAGIGYQIDTGGAGAGQPQAYWDFDGDSADRSGAADLDLLGDASLVGGAAPGGGSGAANFGGGGDYATAQLDVSESAFTCSMWFRTTSPNGGLFAVVDGDLGAGGHDRHIYLTGGNIGTRVWSNETIVTSGLSLADGAWHHAALVFGGGEGGQRIYVDGALAANGGKASSDFDWQQRVNVGFSNDASQQHFDGDIDEVAVWGEALTAAQIGALAAGVPPDALGGFDPVIVSDVEAEMLDVNASAYLRVPFDAPAAAELDALELRARYDDGFIAYLNGVEIARRGAPAAAFWDSAATSNRPNAEVLAGETIPLNEHLDLLAPTGNVLAVHALNNDPESSNFLFLADLVGLRFGEESERYFLEPTPGGRNRAGVGGFVADTKFSHDRGFYDAPFDVTVTCATPGATLVYTLDGSKPSLANGVAVPAPDAAAPPVATVPIATTTNLRAAAFRDGWEPTDIDTHTYVFLDHVEAQPAAPAGFPANWEGIAADYAVDPDVVGSTLPGYSFREAMLSIPTMSITSAPGDIFGSTRGIYYYPNGRGRAWEREVSLEMWYPDGTSAFQVDCGARLHGNSSRQHGFTPKHPFRLLFRSEYGAGTLRYPLFPGEDVERFDQLVLRGASTDSFPVTDGPPRWINDKGTYLRDQYMRDTLRDLGNVSAGGTYVHLFVNGLYWGLYNPSERPVAGFNAIRFGGEEEEFDVIKDFAEVQDGNRATWDAMMAAAGAGLQSEAAYQRFLGNDPDGTRNPAYEVHLHEPSFIDYMICHIAGGAEDWPDHNYWAARRRGPDSEGWYFFAWDQEISNDNLVRDRSHIFPAQPFESVNAAGSPAFVYDRIRRNATFQQKFRDRVHELFFNGGPMSPAANRARWGRRQNEIDKAIVAESARWGDYRQHPPIKRETLWMGEMGWMQGPGGFWDQNHHRAVQRFRNVGLYPDIDAPEFSRGGGTVPAGTELFFASPHTVYWTLDGSDPRAADGSPAPAATAYTGGVAPATYVAKNAVWRYLDDGSDQGEAWRAPGFDDSAWASGPGQFGYNDGDEATVVSYGPSGVDKHITTYFRVEFEVASASAVSALSLGVLRDDGAAAYLNGVEVARTNLPAGALDSETGALSSVGGADESTFYYPFALDPGLLVDGTNVLAVEVHQVSPNNSDLSFDATLTGTEQSSASPATIAATGPVRARAFDGTEWSGLTEAFFVVGAEPASAANLAVSEVHYRPSGPDAGELAAGFTSAGQFEFLELENIGPLAVELAGARFAEGIDFDFAPAEIPPGGRALLVADPAAFAHRYGAGLPVLGAFANGTALANGGERLLLLDAGGATVRDFTYDDAAPWPTSPDGGGYSLALIDPPSDPDHALPESWAASLDPGGTPGVGGGGAGYAAWAAAWFDPDSPDFASVSDPLADPDRDGRNNALEFLFGAPPTHPGAENLVLDVEASAGDTFLTVILTRREGAGEWGFEASGDGVSWAEATAVRLGGERIGAGVWRERYRLLPAIDETPRLIRLVVEL